MGLVFCFFPTTHKQEKEEFQIFSNKYFFSFLYMTICRTVFILMVNAFQQDRFCSFLLALRVRTMNFADLDMFYEGLLSMAPKGVWLPFSEVVHMAQGHSWSLEGCKVGPFARRAANQTVARGKRKLVVHHSRMIWVVRRFSGKRAGMPMRPKSTLQGAPSPAEDLKSVKKVCGFQVLRGDNR